MDEFLREWALRMPDEKADSLLVDMVSYEMREKLRKKRVDGKGGWFGPNCSDEFLYNELISHIAKGDWIDVINFAGMLLARERLFQKTPDLPKTKLDKDGNFYRLFGNEYKLVAQNIKPSDIKGVK